MNILFEFFAIKTVFLSGYGGWGEEAIMSRWKKKQKFSFFIQKIVRKLFTNSITKQTYQKICQPIVATSAYIPRGLLI